ncbi:MAG TPA: hypothetical protein VLE97_11615 [Gaiellaceae bacterium]|nr:hypothetical protein [Gaiellaceae bacterium]
MRKCGLCRASGHNITTCPKRTPVHRDPPAVLMRNLIDPMQAVHLVVEGTAGQAVANATRQIGELKSLGPWCPTDDIVIALAEVELRGRHATEEIEAVRKARAAIDAAKAALDAAERGYARSIAEVLTVLGYEDHATTIGYLDRATQPEKAS